jgi:hypothetical protein
MTESTRYIDSLQFPLEQLGATEAEAELICARMTGIIMKAAASDPALAALWLDAYASGLREVAALIRGQPGTRDIELALQRMLVEDDA